MSESINMSLTVFTGGGHNSAVNSSYETTSGFPKTDGHHIGILILVNILRVYSHRHVI